MPNPNRTDDVMLAEEPTHEPTRERVARMILERGPQTAAALAEQLGLTPAAVRRHLDTLLADGMVEARAERPRGPRGRGRPAKVFALTDFGRDTFPQAYGQLAASALTYLRDTGGEASVVAFARYVIGQAEDRYRAAVDGAGADQSADPRDSPATNRSGTTALAEALSLDGYAASVEPARFGEQLCQHHCPVAHVAEQFPQLCEAETEAFARILGRHVQRLATIAHGDGVCTTHVPDPGAVANHTSPGPTMRTENEGTTGLAVQEQVSPGRAHRDTSQPETPDWRSTS